VSLAIDADTVTSGEVAMRRKRRVLLWAVILAWAAVAPAVAQETPVRGGTLVVGISADPGHLNPAITTSGPTHTAAELLYNGLLGRNERGEPTPDLAESWTVEQAGALYRFRLRDGARWHDGAPFTSADVKFTFDEVLLSSITAARGPR
jgi:peptide/nickel transport system substrate-binding protein